MLSRQRVVLIGSLVAPLIVSAAIVPLRGSLANTNAALLLVVVVVAIAANGYRPAGVCAALSAGLWFDFFLTKPYETFSINDRADIETTALLLVVGVAVAELAVWGRGQQAKASRLAGYAEGIQAAVESVAEDTSPAALIDQVNQQLTRVLQLDRCRFDYGYGVVGGEHPRLRPDGQVEVQGRVYDVEQRGLPPGQEIEILLASAGVYLGRFVLTATAGSRPSLAQRLVAVTLADRVAETLSQHRGRG